MGAATIYALMVIIPAVLLVVMLLLGADTDMDVDADVDVDVDLDMGDVDVSDIAGPGKIGLKLVLAFVLGFGLAGFLTVKYKFGIHHVLAGFIGGAAVYTIVYQLLKLLYKRQGNTQIRAARMGGRKARVVSAVKKGGVGEIQAVDPATGHTHYVHARAADPEAEFAQGEEVVIKSMSVGLAIVDPVEPAASESEEEGPGLEDTEEEDKE